MVQLLETIGIFALEMVTMLIPATKSNPLSDHPA
jgi:hypothetical protein